MSMWANDRNTMRIAVIGTGNIGGTLGRAWARAGHDVAFGSRHPDGNTVSVADALAGSDVVLLALPGRSVGELLADHAGSIDGKLVIDATNQIGAGKAHA